MSIPVQGWKESTSRDASRLGLISAVPYNALLRVLNLVKLNDLLTPYLIRWSLFVGLIIIVALSLAAWFFSPKGENQTYVVQFPPNVPRRQWQLVGSGN
jgi:phosphoglycerol transferase MdoB-like AlkP superfamily enzyme